MQDIFSVQYARRIAARRKQLGKTKKDIRTRNKEIEKNPEFIILRGRTFTEHKKAWEFLRAISEHTILNDEMDIGTYKGFKLVFKKDSFDERIVIREAVPIQWKSKK